MKKILYIITLLCIFSCSEPEEIQPYETKSIDIEEQKQEGVIIEVDTFTTKYEFDIYI